MADDGTATDQRERVRATIAARRAEKYRRKQWAARRGRKGGDDARRPVPAEGGTRFVDARPGALGRIGRMLRPFT